MITYERLHDIVNYDPNTGIKGVSWSQTHKKWVAHLQYRQVCYNLGHFVDIQDAIDARKKAENRFGFDRN